MHLPACPPPAMLPLVLPIVERRPSHSTQPATHAPYKNMSFSVKSTTTAGGAFPHSRRGSLPEEEREKACGHISP